MIEPNEFKTLVTFYDTKSVSNLDTGGMSVEYTNPRQEYGRLCSLKPVVTIGGVGEVIRDSSHILTTRYRSDMDSTTTITRDVFNDDYTTRTEYFSINSTQLVEQEGRYIIFTLSLITPNGSIISTGAS